jgi:hypothetical protein
MHSIASKAVLGVSIVLLMLFALCLVTIFIWMINWQVFVLAGTSITWFVVACGYACLCWLYYEPYLHWFDDFNRDASAAGGSVRHQVPGNSKEVKK